METRVSMMYVIEPFPQMFAGHGQVVYADRKPIAVFDTLQRAEQYVRTMEAVDGKEVFEHWLRVFEGNFAATADTKASARAADSAARSLIARKYGEDSER
jgi:hypothetical protein